MMMKTKAKTKTKTKTEPVDMSPSAIALRLEEVRALCRLGEYLQAFRPVNAPASNDQ